MVYDLFYSFIHVGFVWSALSAFAGVGLFVGFVATTATHQNNAVRGVSALYALLFGGVTLVLVALGGALQSPNLFIVPPQLMQMGQVAGALLPAVAAISVVSTWVTHRTPDDKFDSVGSAVGHYLMNLAKLVGVLASMAFGFYFGTSHGVQGKDLGSFGGQKPEEVTWRDEAPELVDQRAQRRQRCGFVERKPCG